MSNARLTLSWGGPPRLPGYSQSMSSPSKFLVRKNFIVELTNSDLVLFNNAISLKALLPKFHPPTANEVFKDGFSIFKLLNLSYLKKKENIYNFVYALSFKNFFRQRSLVFHNWLSERFNLVDACIMYVGFKYKWISYALSAYLCGTVYLAVVIKKVDIYFPKIP